MKKEFSKAWASSKKPNKQRKFRFNAPLHIKQKFVHVHLSKELRKKYGKRNVGLKKGDRVSVSRGQFKKKSGKVERIDLKKSAVYITGIELIKKDGSKVLLHLEPSNLMITELNLEDKKRSKLIESKGKKEDKKEAKKK